MRGFSRIEKNMNTQNKVSLNEKTEDLNDLFVSFYNEYVEKVYGYIARQVWNHEEAEDLTSQTFIKAWKSFHSFDVTKASFKTWVFRIARNTVYDFFKTQKQCVDMSEYADIILSDTDIEREYIQKEILEEVQSILKTLPSKTQEIIRMRLWEGLSYKEIAFVLHQSEGSVKMSFSRGIQRIQKDMPHLVWLSYFLKLWLS